MLIKNLQKDSCVLIVFPLVFVVWTGRSASPKYRLHVISLSADPGRVQMKITCSPRKCWMLSFGLTTKRIMKSQLIRTHIMLSCCSSLKVLRSKHLSQFTFTLIICKIFLCGISSDSLSPDQRLHPLRWVDLILLVLHCLHFERFSEGGDYIFPKPSNLVIAFSNLLCANGQYIARGRFAYCGECVERSLVKRVTWNPKMSLQAVK